MVKPGILERKAYNRDELTQEERWEEIIDICAAIIAEASQGYSDK